jgi:eukaryotic-like serine/threonine-protein kinase
MTPSEGRPRYRLDSRIATGGMGEVWRATDTVLEREVAVKVLKPEYADDPSFRSRFETEARNAAALHHPNVASVFDFGELPADGPAGGGAPRPYLVMELVRGQPLSALLRTGEPMPAGTAADLVAQAADGLAAAHALGIVHRDVKPANLLVTPDRTVKVTDFGIARAADAVALTQTGQVLGTPQYLSPEQAEGKPATPASDIYSLGVVLYECLAGRRPFDGDTPISTALAHLRQEPPPLPANVPGPLREAVAVALAKNPEARYRTVQDLAVALRGGPVRPGVPVPAPAADAPTAVVPAAAAVAPAAAGTRVLTTTTTGPPPDDRGPRRGLPGWLPWAAAAVAVVALLLVVAKLSGRDSGADTGASADPGSSQSATSGGQSPTRSPSPTKRTSSAPSPSRTSSSPPEDDRITVDAGDYVGRPADDARKDLEDLGFKVDDETVENPGDKEKDTVADVSPTGLVEPGRTITLSVYDDPPVEVSPTPTPDVTAPGPGNDNDNGNDKGDGKAKGKGEKD